jgi:DNA-binding NarL/FixJ family response regulator
MKLLVADDHALIREAVTDAFEAHGFEVASVEDGLSLIGFLELNSDTDAVLLDSEMPGVQGAELVALVRKRFPGVKIVLMTASDDEAGVSVEKAKRGGIQGYARKSEPSKNLVQIVRQVLEGKRVFPIVEQKERTLPSDWRRKNGAGYTQLTGRQREILAFVAEGFSNREIAEKLDLSENTVKVHVHAVLKMLGAKNRTQAAAEARKARLVPS